MIVERDGIVSLEKENALFTKQRNENSVRRRERERKICFICLFHCIEFKL